MLTEAACYDHGRCYHSYTSTMRITSSISFVLLGLFLKPAVVHAQRIAVIGGGIGGSFVTKYLVDYDDGADKCNLDSITVFEPMPLKGPIDASSTIPDDSWQGSRVQSVRLRDGTIVEVGASIGYKDFHLVIDMIRNDPNNLEIGRPFNTGSSAEIDKDLRSGVGIYDGEGQWPLLLSDTSKFVQKLMLLLRYNFDLIKVSRICKQSLNEFAKIPSLLASNLTETFYDSPDDIWNATRL